MNINAHAASDFKCIYNQTIQGASVAHLSERAARLSPLLTWVQFPLGTSYDSYVKRVSQRSAESRGFSPGTPVSSWLTDEIEDDQISISGYVIQRKDRTHGRGVCMMCVYVSQQIPITRCLELGDLNLECMWLWARPPRLPRPLSAIAVCVVYNSPDKCVQEQRELCDYLVSSIDSIRSK